MHKKFFLFAALPCICLVLLLASALTVTAYEWNSFGFEDKGASKSLKLNIPDIALTPKEEQALYDGKPIAKLLDAPGGLKKGYLRFFAPFDPVTAWMVVTDAAHFDLVDPSFPKSGSLTDQRRTYMPYTFDVTDCVEDGREKMYQLLVMPVVSPRKLCINRYHNADGFPWESYWTKADHMCCLDKADPKIKAKYFDKAVTLEKNNGAWHISPLPKKFRKTEADLMRTDLIYFVDTNPGGDLGKIKAVVNKATSVALPALQENVLFHGKRWEPFLAKYHGAAMVQKYKTWQAQYKEAMAGQ